MFYAGKTAYPNGAPGTLAVIGDLKQMKPKWLRGISMQGYGATMTVGIGVPIPILSEEILKYTTVTDAEIYARFLTTPMLTRSAGRKSSVRSATHSLSQAR